MTVKDSKGKTLKKNTDYTVSYAKGRKYVGKYAVKVTFKGNYSGTKTLYFTINPKGTKLSSVKAGKKQVTAKWKSQKSQKSGYQVQHSTSKSFKGAKTVTVNSNKTTSKTIKNLKGGKKYYVRVRTFKKVGKHNIIPPGVVQNRPRQSSKKRYSEIFKTKISIKKAGRRPKKATLCFFV